MKRTREQVIWDFVQGWLQKAEGDLLAANRLIEVEQEDYFTTTFHAQQVAEKFLKEFLVCHQIPFPKTHDIQQLLAVLNRLRDHGNTVVVIEHNLDVIKTADWLIDLGPEGGDGGGLILATGTPEEVAQDPASHTGEFLKQVLEPAARQRRHAS